MHRLILSLIGMLFSCAAAAQPAPQATVPPPGVAAVMAPLSFLPRSCRDATTCRIDSEVLNHFDDLLVEARDTGVAAVSVDMWWRLIEPTDDKFEWSYYDTIFDRIAKAGLKVVPILSFHRCGSGPGDVCDFALPDWLWDRFQAQGLSSADLKYESETGRLIADALPPWATENAAVLDQLVDVIRSFRQHYADRAKDFAEINISLGPTGELRYPAYDGEDCWSYPDRGNFVAYGRLAQQSFSRWAIENLGGLDGVNARWGTALHSADDIRPPDGDRPAPGSCAVRRAQGFVDRRDYEKGYGLDFVDWYNRSLAEHGRRLLTEAHRALDGPFATVPLGMKIPGVHWRMTCLEPLRIAEITAGLVQTRLNLKPEAAAQADAYGYKRILDTVQQVKQHTGREVVLHFTALEKGNSNACPLQPNGDDTSMAKALVFWIGNSAGDRSIVHRGENALACNDSQNGCDTGWGNVRNAFQYAGYSGFTLLRLVDNRFFQLTGNQAEIGKGGWNAQVKDEYKNFIAQCIANSCATAVPRSSQ